MIKKFLFAVLLIALLSMSGLQVRSADIGDPASVDAGISRSYDHDRSCLTFNSSDGSWTSESEDSISPTGHYVKIDDHKLQFMGSVEGGYQSIYLASNWRSIQEYRGMAYLAFVTIEGDDLLYNFARSTDNGLNWAIFEVERDNDTYTGYAELLINEDKIFYLINRDVGVGLEKSIDVKVTPYYNWMNLSSVLSKRVASNTVRLESSMVPMPGRTIVFYKSAGFDWLRYIAYDNGWTTERSITFKMNTFHAAFLGDAASGSLNLYSVSRTDRSEIGTIESTDKGDSWGAYKMAYQTTAGISFLSGSPNGDHTDIAFNHLMNNDIVYARGYPGSITDILTVVSPEDNALDPTGNELAISSEGNEVAIAHEGSDGRVMVARSRDSGRNFTQDQLVGSGNAHCVSMSTDMRFFIIAEGADLTIFGFVPSDDAMMRSRVLTFPAISSWDGIYFQAGGVSEEGDMGFRVLSSDLSSVYFPADGWEDLYGSGPASLDGLEYNHHVPLNITLASIPAMRSGIVIEVRMSRVNGMDPNLFAHAIDFSTSYPYREDFSVPENVLEAKGCTVSASGMALITGNASGHCVIGPIIRESPGPEHLSVYCKFLAGGASVSFSIKDMNGLDIEGFSGPMAKPITEQEREVYVKWGTQNLGNIPEDIEWFCVRIDIQKGQALSPRVMWVEFKPSALPVVEGIVLEKPEIYRGNDMSIGIRVSDKEEPVKDLAPSIEVRDPRTGAWTNSIVSDPFWNGTSWTSLFHPHMDVPAGLYRVRVSVVDGIGRTGGFIEMDEAVFVRNNPPDPPKLRIVPDRLVNGSQLIIETLIPGSDMETDSGELLYNLTISVNGEAREVHEGLKSPDMNLPALDLRKGDMVHIEVGTWDGEDLGEMTVIDSVVENSPPMADQTFNRIVLDEDTSLTINVGAHFTDADPEPLSFTYGYPKQLSVNEKAPGSVELKADAEYFGGSFLRIVASDGTESVGLNVTVDVNSVNDPPSWADPVLVIANEGEWKLVPIGAEDITDPEPVLVTSSLTELPGIVPGINMIQNPNGSCLLRPTNDMIGTHGIDVIVADSEHSINYSFTLVVNNRNTPPTKPEVTIQGGSWSVFSDEKIRLTAISTDEDEMWGDSINYSWTSSIQGAIGAGSILEPILQLGEHRIYVNVSDDTGLGNSTVFTLTIIEHAASERSVIRTWVLYAIAFMLGLVLAISAIVLFFVLTHPKKEPMTVEKVPEEGKKDIGSLKPPTEMMRKELPPVDGGKPPEKQAEKPAEGPQERTDPANVMDTNPETQKADTANTQEAKP
jgi:hypothetical protein